MLFSPSAAEEGFIEGAKWAEKELSIENLYAELNAYELDNKRLEKALAELKEKYRWILIDELLPETPKEKVLKLIAELEKFTVVKQKSNLSRLLK